MTRENDAVTGEIDPDSQIVDVTGRYRVTVGDKVWNTVCRMDIERGIVVEQYIDQNGRTVLWRRFNRDDWAFSKYGRRWREILPENQRLFVNGEAYIHWYDCLSDYVLG